MRDFFRGTYNVFTVYEGALLLLALLLPLIAIVVYSYRVSKDRKLIFTYLLSTLGSLIAFSIASYAIQYFWRDVTNGLMQIAFYLTLIGLFGTLQQLFLYYREEMSQKRFDPDHVTRKHFRFSVDAGVAFTLILMATLIFLPTLHRVVVTTSLFSLVLTVALSHASARLFLRDKKNS